MNQQRHVVEEVLACGRQYGFGLEAGSKPELLAVLALTNGGSDDHTPIICNGFKDDEFIKMVILARKIGKPIIPVVEKFTELETIVKHAQELDVRPVIGVRVKLSTRGAGKGTSAARTANAPSASSAGVFARRDVASAVLGSAISGERDLHTSSV